MPECQSDKNQATLRCGGLHALLVHGARQAFTTTSVVETEADFLEILATNNLD